MRKQIESPFTVFKPLTLVRDHPFGARSALGGITRRRLDNQLTRAFQQSFGAEQGLRVVVRIAMLEMHRAGATPDQIRQELTDVVLTHPSNAPPSVP